MSLCPNSSNLAADNLRVILRSPCLCQTSVGTITMKTSGTDGSAGARGEHWSCAPTRELCSHGLFEEGALLFHPPTPGDHPGACAKCGQVANPDSGCS